MGIKFCFRKGKQLIVASVFFEQLMEDRSYDDLFSLAKIKFNPQNDEETATLKNDLDEFLQSLREKGILEE